MLSQFKNILIVLLLFVAGFFWYKAQSISVDPIEELKKLTFVPANFSESIDEERALVILKNPDQHEAGFDSLVFQFNMAMVNHVANRLNARDSDKEAMLVEYGRHHDYLKGLYLTDIRKYNDPTDDDLEDKWYQEGNKKAVDALNEVGSKYACFLINHIVKVVLEENNGNLKLDHAFLQTPCALVMKEALEPMIQRMQERASIIDLDLASKMFEQKTKTVISELSNVEVRDKKAISKELQTKVWGYTVSQTDLDISAVSVLKVGFDLKKFFGLDIDTKNKKVIVKLPEPKILSHQVFPKIEKLDIGWLREVDKNDFNKNFNFLRAAFREEAITDGVYETSKEKAKESIGIFIEPLLMQLGPGYEIEMQFPQSIRPKD